MPELRDVPAKHIHEPWLAPAHVLSGAGVVLGVTYPERHAFANDYAAAKALAAGALRTARQEAIAGGTLRSDGGGYDMVELPGGSTVSHDGRAWRIFTVQWLRSPGGARPPPPPPSASSASSAARKQTGGKPPGAPGPSSKKQRTLAEAFQRAGR